MSCKAVERRLSAYLEQAVSEGEAQQLSTHLQKCPNCARKAASQRQVRISLRSLPRMTPPPDLTVRLRVLASKDRPIDRRPPPRLRNWRQDLKLFLDNLMKPLALPAAGGLAAAILLFTALMPTISSHHLSVGEDVPIYDLAPSTEASLRSVPPIGFQYGDAEVDLRIDEHGRIINYSIVGGSGHDGNALRRSIENNLLFTTFKPATSYGVPTTGKIRLSFRSSSIDVKG